MKFFDDKEEVIDIQLTQYGKYLLSKGKFRAKYYAFYDDDIIYDGTYAGYSEDQNNVEYRIFNETPRVRTQYVYSGVETKMKLDQEAIISNKDLTPDSRFQQTPEREYATARPLSNSSLMSNYMPAYKLNFLSGEISSSFAYETGSQPNLAIPQVNMEDSEYISYVETTVAPLPSQINESSNIFIDGTYFKTDKNDIIIKIEEQNGVSSQYNFDIEFYLVEEVEEGSVTPGVPAPEQPKREVLTPLKFRKTPNNIKDGIISPLPVLEIESFDFPPNYVEHYFNIEIDSELDICDEAISDRDRDIFLGKASSCKEEDNENLLDIEEGIYETDVDLGGECE
tara:strand:+ start:2227 stop:3243 length:1017 start_codon:yes stop_codon:yes gene_type:complete